MIWKAPKHLRKKNFDLRFAVLMASQRNIAWALVAVAGLGVVLAILSFRSEDSPFQVLVFSESDDGNVEWQGVTVVVTNVSLRSHRLINVDVAVMDGNGRWDPCIISWKTPSNKMAALIRPHRMKTKDSVTLSALIPHGATPWIVHVVSRPEPNRVQKLIRDIHYILPFPDFRGSPKEYTFEFSGD
jgi:hypothetical protein